MLITRGNLDGLFAGYKMSFNQGFEGIQPLWPRLAMKVNSKHREETYGWMEKLPQLREWVGDRVVHGVATSGYTLRNRTFELTIAVDREDIEDDTYGIHTPLFAEMGQSAAEHPDKLLFELLASGFSTTCYDGQFFFDTDHPLATEGQTTTTVSNFGGGSGTAWYLLDTSRAIRPLLFQERRPFGNLIRKDSEDDDNVFLKREFMYGTDGRGNAGFGLWQLAYASKQPLTAENYAAARSAMLEMVGDNDRKLGIRPTVLLVPTTLESAGRKILNSEYGTGGETNEWKGTAELITTPWL